MKKSHLRKKLIKKRKLKFRENLSIDFKKILSLINKKKMKSKNIVGGYYPVNYEIDDINILDRFEKKGFKISLPKIKKKFQMDFFKFSGNDILKVNKYGIPEPLSRKKVLPDILLVPIVGFDKNLNRIGYGAGYYDRAIAKIKKRKKVLTIGLAYHFQEVKFIPINKYDYKLDFIVTDKKVF
ncbi:MAG: 5-formyltetrahydrofolate cyclo-ligase [Candidatus Pelagibacter sp. TMED275]|nr:MAG: 5-formyltetrahydrofolate cyclo-ligase [Candidatus Pelagibacter sp. TMED275]